MLIQITMDTAQRKDIELAHNTIGYMLGFIPQQNTAQSALAAIGEAVQTGGVQTTQTGVAAPAAQDTKPEPSAKATKGKGKASAKEATTEPSKAGSLTLADMRGKLQSYSDDSRYGMSSVLAILNKYGVQRISDLPDNKYPEMAKEIDEALTGKENPLA